MATADDRCWSAELMSRAADDWHALLRREQCIVPQWLAADLGMLLIRPDATLRSAPAVGRDYVAVLDRMRYDASFQQCSRIVIGASKEFRDQAIRTAIAALARPVQGTDESQVVAVLMDWVNGRKAGGLLASVDLVHVRAAARMRNGARALDHQLLAECIRPWPRVSEHPLQAKAVPLKLVGERAVSRRAGDIAGYTAVRPRLPTDALGAVLPSDWALVKRNRFSGVDKILNRDTLVYQRESPVDLVPRLRVLVAMLIDAGPPLALDRDAGGYQKFREAATHVPSQARSQALAYRMIVDAAGQVPFDKMSVDVAVYLGDARVWEDPARFGSDHSGCATCFDLKEVEVNEPHAAVCFDERAPFYFCYSQVQSLRWPRPQGAWPDLSDDPWSFLTDASAAIATYTAVLAVIFSQPRRWNLALPSRLVPLRPVEYRRSSVILVEPRMDSATRRYRWRGYDNLNDASATRGGQLALGTDQDIRGAFLNMLLGPERPAAPVSASRPLVVE
jgi:hypothetical protein